MFFPKILMNNDNITNINSIIINKKLYTYPFNPIFFKLLIAKSLEIFPTHSGYGFNLESFALI